MNFVEFQDLHDRKYDLYVVGSGIAAVSLIENLDRKIKILVIEIGGKQGRTNQSIKSQVGHVEDWDFHSVHGLFGTSVTWDNHILAAPLVKDELATWPISYDIYQKHVKAAARKLGIAGDVFHGIPSDTSFDAFFPRPLWSCELPKGYFNSGLSRKNVDILLNTEVESVNIQNGSAVDVQCRVEGVVASIPVQGAQLVLAAGGLGNAQILKRSEKDGLSLQQSEHFGNFLMEHPHGFAGDCVLKKGEIKRFEVNPTNLRPYERSVSVKVRSDIDGADRFVTLLMIPRDLTGDSEVDVKIGDLLASDPEIENFGLYAISEMRPSAHNKIDFFDGISNPSLYDSWMVRCIYSAADFEAIRSAINLFLDYIVDLKIGFGRFDNSIYSSCTGGGHPMGTTVAAHTAKQGVVNGQLQLFDCDNAYIVGSSVFPTGGAVGPTLSVVALSLYVSDQINEKYL